MGKNFFVANTKKGYLTATPVKPTTQCGNGYAITAQRLRHYGATEMRLRRNGNTITA